MLVGHLVLLARTAQPGICHYGRKHVCRELNFGNHLHLTQTGVFQNLADVVLRVKTTQTAAVGTGPGSHLGQTGIFLDFQTPSGIINQMELEFVEFIHGHHVDELLDKLLIVEITGHIEHHATPRAFRMVHNLHAGHGPCHLSGQTVAIHLFGEQLQQSLQAVKYSGYIRSGNPYTLLVYRQGISFGMRIGHRVQRQHNISFPGIRTHLNLPSCGLTQHLLQVSGLLFQTFLAGNRHA